jgi:hypothetical protein
MRDDFADVGLNAIFISCGNWYVQARQQAGHLGNPSCVVVDPPLSHRAAGLIKPPRQ